MDLNLKDKVAVVTGASKGIGLAIAEQFLNEGAKVVAVSRSLSAELKQLMATNKVIHVPMDVAAAKDVKEISSKLIEPFGRIDILVNNAGAIDTRKGIGFMNTTNEDWEELYNLNFFSVVRFTQAVVPHLLKQKHTSIVNISSVNAYLPEVTYPIYGTTKAAMNNLTKLLAAELGSQQIRVNSISPGPVKTDMWTEENGLADEFAKKFGTTPENAMEKFSEMAGILLRRLSESKDIAELTVFLASERANMITACDYAIDGGVLKKG
ncbi:SDR family NAD(P)-dependent oxidoreductase [Paenibacillus sp. CF384]|uniref:SDR family NAD(P)-dependent oxidoreductase n=1 Tax=Paenibacillus sp. CF384 TaxID=1884382 RepID=UPI00089BAD26|nr:SDR family oxidoreductase [Paenibacillus sp. CF384]SDW10108.1 NAD(P)-dependent dehydrogenase, short-chain alcohol dehydrogenase family [Paenibacillus sp. CF384]